MAFALFTGLVTSACLPAHSNNKFIGVACVDFTSTDQTDANVIFSVPYFDGFGLGK